MALAFGLTILLVALAWAAKRWIPWPRLRLVAAVGLSVGAVAFAAYGGVRAWANLRPPPAPSAPRELARGIVYERRVDTALPRVEHWVTVDLTTPGLEIVVPDGDDGVERPIVAYEVSEIVTRDGLVFATNGGFFWPWVAGLIDPYPKRGERVAPVGIGARAGHVFGEEDPRVRTVFFDEKGTPTFERPERIYSAMSGGCMLVEHGAKVPLESCKLHKANRLRQPRTALGVDAERKRLSFVVIDGRQRRYSAGATLDELADLMLRAGVADAINLDGGGSSVVAARDAAGEAEVLNDPISGGVPGHERVVGTYVGVRLR